VTVNLFVHQYLIVLRHHETTQFKYELTRLRICKDLIIG